MLLASLLISVLIWKFSGIVFAPGKIPKIFAESGTFGIIMGVRPFAAKSWSNVAWYVPGEPIFTKWACNMHASIFWSMPPESWILVVCAGIAEATPA